MKTLMPILLLALLCCQCKDPYDNCAEICKQGFVCDDETGTCICPEGSFIFNSQCIPIQSYMYVPVAENSSCSCFKDINVMWIDSNSTDIRLKFAENLPYSQTYHFTYFSLEANTDTLLEWAYRQEYVIGFAGQPLPCKIGEQFLDAHFYANFDEDTIRIKADIIPYHSDDWLHLQEYPVLETCELLFVR
jgi:hypothetical protein